MEETVGFQSLRMRFFYEWVIGACGKWSYLKDMERVNLICIKVSALRLFHPTASSILFGLGFYYCDTVSFGRGKK
jgi:hypothetical protein